MALLRLKCVFGWAGKTGTIIYYTYISQNTENQQITADIRCSNVIQSFLLVWNVIKKYPYEIHTDRAACLRDLGLGFSYPKRRTYPLMPHLSCGLLAYSVSQKRQELNSIQFLSSRLAKCHKYINSRKLDRNNIFSVIMGFLSYRKIHLYVAM